MNKIPFFHFIWIFQFDHIWPKNLGDDHNYPMLYLVSGLEIFNIEVQIQFMHYCDNIQEKAGWLLSVLHQAGDWPFRTNLNLYRRWVFGARWCRILQSDDLNQNPNIKSSSSYDLQKQT